MTTLEDSRDLIDGLDDYDKESENDTKEALEIIYNEALGSLGKILMPLNIDLEKNIVSPLPESVLDKHVDVSSKSSRMEYHSEFEKLRDVFGYFGDSREFELKDLKYGETRAGNPVFIFEAERRFEVENLRTHDIEECISAYTPLAIEIDEDIILRWFSKLVRPEGDIRDIVPNKERERVLERAKRFGIYLNIVDDFKEGYLPEY
jgi:hypothetical protein